nr:hypothetical protein Q903MT_gene5115 [Picea sitchensis]
MFPCEHQNTLSHVVVTLRDIDLAKFPTDDERCCTRSANHTLAGHQTRENKMIRKAHISPLAESPMAKRIRSP